MSIIIGNCGRLAGAFSQRIANSNIGSICGRVVRNYSQKQVVSEPERCPLCSIYKGIIATSAAVGGIIGGKRGLEVGYLESNSSFSAAFFMPLYCGFGAAYGAVGGGFLGAIFPISIPSAAFYHINNKNHDHTFSGWGI